MLQDTGVEAVAYLAPWRQATIVTRLFCGAELWPTSQALRIPVVRHIGCMATQKPRGSMCEAMPHSCSETGRRPALGFATPTEKAWHCTVSYKAVTNRSELVARGRWLRTAGPRRTGRGSAAGKEDRLDE